MTLTDTENLKTSNPLICSFSLQVIALMVYGQAIAGHFSVLGCCWSGDREVLTLCVTGQQSVSELNFLNDWTCSTHSDHARHF